MTGWDHNKNRSQAQIGIVIDTANANLYHLCLLHTEKQPVQALLVGADHLGNIPEMLTDHGISIHRHISGRDKAHQRRQASLPRQIQLVILFTDFLAHNVMQSFRAAARDRGIPVVCCRRSACSLRLALAAVARGACAQCPNRRGLGGPVRHGDT